MSLNRVWLVAAATIFTAGLTSAAYACCDMGARAPVVYATPVVAYAPPAVVTVEVVPPPVVAVAGWRGGWGRCGGCGGCGGCGAAYAVPVVDAAPIAPAPIYVVNQGPEYSGPGIMVPFRTYSRAAAFAPAVDTPYVRGYGYGHRYGFWPRRFYGPRFYGSRFGYGSRLGFGPRFYGARVGYGSRFGYGARFAFGPRMFPRARFYGGMHWRR